MALFRWCDAVLPPGPDGGGIVRLAAVARSPALASEARALEDRLYGAGGGADRWDGTPLRAAARAARRHLRRRPPAHHARAGALPDLNPHGAAGPPPPRVTLPRWAR